MPLSLVVMSVCVILVLILLPLYSKQPSQRDRGALSADLTR